MKIASPSSNELQDIQADNPFSYYTPIIEVEYGTPIVIACLYLHNKYINFYIIIEN